MSSFLIRIKCKQQWECDLGRGMAAEIEARYADSPQRAAYLFCLAALGYPKVKGYDCSSPSGAIGTIYPIERQ